MSKMSLIQPDIEAQVVRRKTLRSTLKGLFLELWNPLKLYFLSFPVPLCICDNRHWRAISKNITTEDTIVMHEFKEKRIVILQTQPFE
ncbi:unnamed protein product [Caenorhabditis angaria]|uniref:Uncharacterized protein n=1 Tax=Caenorhabditis angaria TaxID=860376 RepID=A0A9P1N392_9PELO|nr:unnamed protein product [Caenorhabditis angaria]